MRAKKAMLTAVALSLGWAGAASADGHPVVVELFTSQGCSSCPPADALLRQIAQREDVIALALHVDYWDYIGWTDVFADAAFTRRQKAYAAAAGEHTVYTPQMVVGGVDHLVGTRAMELGQLIESHGAAPRAVDLDVRAGSARLTIRAVALNPLRHGVVIQLVRFRPEETVAIERGENAGHTITYANIVTDWQVIGSWSGAAPLEMTAEAPGPDRAVVILQEEGPGAILAAAVAR